MKFEQIRKEWTLKPGNEEAETAAWDSAAEEYVIRSKRKLDEDPFLKFMTERVAFNDRMSSFDVGCGAGAYSIALSSKVGKADGVDLSPRMIELGNAYVKEHNINNVHLWVKNWHTCDIDDIRGRYDIVFAHTTPAVADYTTLVKMCEVSKDHCFFCKPARRTDSVFDELKRIAGRGEDGSWDDSVAYTFDTLWGLGYEPEVTYTKTVWTPERSLEDSYKWYISRLRGAGDIDETTEQKIRDYLLLISKDNIVSELIDTTLVNMYWRVTR